MPETMQKLSARFKVGKVAGVDRKPLTRTGHATHVESALSIFGDAKIRGGLPNDGGRFDTERILIVFSSPYDFSERWGCMYGNVLFQVNWDKLIEGKRFYWIEVQEYSSERPRILVTEKKHPELERYWPEKTKGPLLTLKDRHYWNGLHKVEILVEGDIPLSQIAELKFIKGHPENCRSEKCTDKGHDKQSVAARLLAGACARNLLPASRRLWIKKATQPRNALLYAWKQLRILLARKHQKRNGSIKAASNEAGALAWSVLAALYHRENDILRKHLGSFIGPNNAIKSCARLIEDRLELRRGILPRD